MWAALKLAPLGAKIGLAIGALLMLVAAFGSVYYVGYNKGVNIAAAEIARFENASQRIQNSFHVIQGKSDLKIVTEFKDRVAYIDRVVYKNRDVVRTNVVSQGKFTKGWIYAYNQSVQGLEVDPVLAADSTLAPVSDVDALADTIIPNNGISLSTQEKLNKLQEWIRQTKINQEAANASTNK